jgi:hypothetical protein
MKLGAAVREASSRGKFWKELTKTTNTASRIGFPNYTTFLIEFGLKSCSWHSLENAQRLYFSVQLSLWAFSFDLKSLLV